MKGPKKGTKYQKRAGPFGLKCIRCNNEQMAEALKQRTLDERATFFLFVVRALAREHRGERLPELKLLPDEEQEAEEFEAWG